MKLPPILIRETDRERLFSTAIAALSNERPVPAASMLLSEIGRAKIVAGDSLPRGVVAMYSRVEIRDNVVNRRRWVRLVYPEEAANDCEFVSILTPLGAALVGLSEGDSIDWCNATGDWRSVTVLRVCPPSDQDETVLGPI